MSKKQSISHITPKSNIPKDWKFVSLGDIGKLDTSGVNKKKIPSEEPVRLVNYMDVYRNYRINSDIDFMEVTAPESQVKRSQVNPGDILFTPSSEEPGDIGHSAVVTEYLNKTLHSYHTVRLRPTNNEIELDTNFSGWIANAPYVLKQFTRRATGSTRFTLTLKDFTDTRLLVPPLPEQRKIASVLYNVDRAIQKTEEIIEQTKRVKKGIMQDLFTEGYFEHENSKEIRIGPIQTEIPENWKIKSLIDITEKVTEIDHKMPDKTEEGIPFLAAGDIANGSKIDFDEVEKISEKDYERLSKKFDAEKGDILYTRFGTIGVARKVDFDHKFVASYSVALIKPDEEICSSYLTSYLNSITSRKEAKNRTRGSANRNLNLGEIKKLSIILPTKKEQEKISQVIKQINLKIKKENKYLKNLQRLKKGLMQDLLTGKVRTKDKPIEILPEVKAHG